MLRRWILTALLACGPCTHTLAQGDFELERIPGAPAQPTVEVNLNAALLGFAAALTRPDDPVTADMLEALDSIRVRVYETLEDAVAVSAFVESASAALERDGWHRVVYVQDDDEKVRVYTRLDGQQMNGMTILVVSSEEAVFVNVAGRIDPEQLGRIAGAVGIGDLIDELTDTPLRARALRGTRN